MNTNVHYLLDLSKQQHQRLLDEGAVQRNLRELTPRKTKKGWLNRNWLTRRQPVTAPPRIVQARG